MGVDFDADVLLDAHFLVDFALCLRKREAENCSEEGKK